MKKRGSSSVLLGRRDLVYLLSLLVPLAVYNVALKAYDVVSSSRTPGDRGGLLGGLDLLLSDVLFNLAFALLFFGLFAAAREGLRRRVVVFLFHAAAVLVLVVTTCADQYFEENGTTLDYATVAEWLPKFGEIVPILTTDVPPSAWAVLCVALFYAIFGPAIVARVVERVARRRGWPSGRPARGFWRRFSVSLGLWMAAFVFVALSVETGATALERDPVTNMVVTGYQQATAEDYTVAAGSVENPAKNATIVPTPSTDKRNVVLVHLESTRAQSTTPYNEDLDTTPFLDELAKESLKADRAYTTVPRSSKASVEVNCGIEPPLYPGPEFEPGALPAPCLAELLKGQGYRTAFFASTSTTMDNFGDVVQGFGYDEFYPVETMDTAGYQVTNTFGYEDDVMLDPSEAWLKQNDDKPFLAEYFTGTGHYGYECSSLNTGFHDFSDDEEYNRYLNCLRYTDTFLKDLIDQYKELGIYDNTIFVIFGDHGEGFNEHGRQMHGDTIWDEGLKVPLIIHDPQRFRNGEEVKGLSSQLDVLPTVLDLLGYEVKDGEYPGYSLLHPLPEDRSLMFSCITARKCMASIKGDQKYIYHFDQQPDEFYDLSKDPLEKNNLADEKGAGELERLRKELLAWQARVNAQYAGSSSQPEDGG